MMVAQKQTSESTAPVMIDIERLRAARLMTSPYDYMIVSGFIRPEWQEKLVADYPALEQAGSFPLATVKCGTDFKALVDEMNGPDFRRAIEEKFSLNLEGKPTMFTVRGKCRLKDGKIHTDTESKIITVLLYMNPEWENQGGRLRLLRSKDNIDDVVAEVPPMIGTLLVFRRSNNSFHGHLPFEGTRRVIQMNWVTEQKFVDRESKRHIWSALMKKLGISY